MLTIILLAIVGTILIGFLLWATVFNGNKRSGQSGESEVKAQKMTQGKRSS